ncbi:MAG: S8 family serine peptidase [Gammaproteobacteria bacterium]|nr:S8 family serine peptidase [Gammaproteobacteria bacterium]
MHRILAPLLRLVIALAACTGTASAALIGVLDTGVNDTGVLGGKIASGGYDFVNDDNDPADDQGHGTAVATRAIAVSPNSLILPIKVLDEKGEGTSTQIVAGLNHAVGSGVDIVNLSFGGDVSTQSEIQALLAAARADVIIVMAAGNEGGDEPTQPALHVAGLGGLGIAVGAIDAANRLQTYSNAAGSTASYYLVTYDGGVGTSIATPAVAGAAAEVLNASPHLSGFQVVEILLVSADDLGQSGPDAIFGMGRLNLAAALAALPPLSVPGGGGGSSSFAAPALVIGSALVYAISRRSKKIQQAVITDRYDRGYTVDLGARLEPAPHVSAMGDWLANLANESSAIDLRPNPGQQLRLWFARPAPGRSVPDTLPSAFQAGQFIGQQLSDEEIERARMALSWRGQTTDGLYYGLNLNTHRDLGLGPDPLQPAFLGNRALSGSYLGFADQADALLAGWALDENSDLRLQYMDMDEDTRYGLDSSSLDLRLRWAASDDVQLSLALSQLDEHGNLLGGASQGAFSPRAATTNAVSLAAEWAVSQRFRVRGHLAEGVTRVQADRRNSIARRFSSLRSRTFGLSLNGHGLWRADDRAGIALTRPLRVHDGYVDLEVPVGQDIRGAIRSEWERVALNPTGAETDLEIYYHAPLGKGRIGAYLLYQNQPWHNEQLNDAVSAFFVFQQPF